MRKFALISILLSLSLFVGCSTIPESQLVTQTKVEKILPPEPLVVPPKAPAPKPIAVTGDIIDNWLAEKNAGAACRIQIGEIWDWYKKQVAK